MTQSRNTLTGSNPVVSATDWSKIDFDKLIDDLELMIANVSEDCYLGGFECKTVQKMFNANHVSNDDIVKAAEILLSIANNEIVVTLKRWFDFEKHARAELEYLNSDAYNPG